MSWFTPGSIAVESTQAPVSGPSTSSIIAEVDSTQVGQFLPTGRAPVNVQATWIVGGSSGVLFRLEQATSTALDMATVGRSLTYAYTAANQSAQFVTKHRVYAGDRFRVRVDAAPGGVTAAKVIVEPLD